jgi:1,4-alpha-glucan branching enzyme
MKDANNLGSYYFHQGTSTEAYNYLGCNMSVVEGEYVYSFRTWAPSADSVSVVADFTPPSPLPIK